MNAGQAAWLDAFEAARAAAHVVELASADKFGRLAGTEGERQAATYISSELSRSGLRPPEGWDRMDDPFEVVVPVLVDAPTLQVEGAGGERSFAHLVDFSVNVQGLAAGGVAEGDSVWVGDFDAQSGVERELDGRVAVCSSIVTESRGGVASGLEIYLDRLARAQRAGARALLQVAELTDRRKVMNHRRRRPGLPALDVSREVQRALFGGSTPAVLASLGARVKLSVPLRDEPRTSAGNLVARVGTGPLKLVLVAHYDHVGGLPDGRWFGGAVDNASGVAVVLETARVLSSMEAELGGAVLVVLTAAEELGNLGARRFADQHAGWLRGGGAVVNLDEIAGLESEPLWLLRTEAFPTGLLRREDGARLGAPVRLAGLPGGGFADHEALVECGGTRIAGLFAPDPAPGAEHTLNDTADRVAPQRLAVAGRALLLMAHRALTTWSAGSDCGLDRAQGR